MADNLTRDEAADRTTKVAGVAYDVTLDLTSGEDTFVSDTTVRFTANLVGLATFVDIDAATVREVTLNGRTVDPATYDADRARIPLRGLIANNVLRVVADCRYQHTGVGLHRFVDPTDGNVYLHTQFEPFDAHRVFACFDQPDMKGPFTLRIRAPEEWTVVSNGPVATSGGGEWAFEPTPEIPSYLAALVAGPYAVARETHGDIELAIYCRQSLREFLDADELFDLTRSGLDFFEAEFDYPYPFDKYDQLFVPEFNFGAMENPGCVTFNEHMVFRARQTDSAHEHRAEVVLHEMAHMWFGDLVTMRWWDDLWLNESFATYMACSSQARATRFRDSWVRFAAGTKAGAAMADQMPTTHPISADIVDTDAVRLHFDGITYAKGASVLKQLVAWVGGDAFRDGVRAYFRRHGWGNAELRDFLAALERTSGRDLDEWAAEWLQTTGVNTLRPEVEVADGTYSSIAVLQDASAASPTVRSHRVAIGLYDAKPGEDGGLVRRRRVELDVVGPRTVVDELAGERVADLLLVNDDDLTYAKVRLDPASQATLDGHLGRVRDPLARNLCWAALWDMVRDAELPARRWTRLVGDHAPGEADDTTLAGLLGQASLAADLYCDPSTRPARRRELAGDARRHLAAAKAGSDVQLVWARHLIGMGEGDEHEAWCRDLLDGRSEVAGLAVDTDLRWLLVGALAALGASDAESRIDAEVERDPTDIGQRRAAAARASQPSAAAKEAAWSRLLAPGMHLAEIRAVAGSFWRCGQEALGEPFVAAYFEAVPRIWAERTPDEALSLLRGLYPSTMVDTGTVKATEGLLADGSLAGPVRRILLEGTDRVERALRARAADRDAEVP